MKDAALFWSGGKDAAYALFLAKKEYNIKYLVTTISRSTERVTMQGIDQKLVDLQSAATGIPLYKMFIEEPSNESYEIAFYKALDFLKEQNISTVVFGDILLEDLRTYRDRLLGSYGFTGVYPLWKHNTTVLLKEMYDSGIRAIICCGDSTFFGHDVLVKEPVNIREGKHDPCGENGEYHTFCFKSPDFKNEIKFRKGEIIEQQYKLDKLEKTFLFLDIQPG